MKKEVKEVVDFTCIEITFIFIIHVHQNVLKANFLKAIFKTY